MEKAREYKRFYCCGDCVNYSARRHKCLLGAKDEGGAYDHFYKDCPLPTYKEEGYVISSKSTGKLLGQITRDLVDNAYLVRVKDLSTGETVTYRRYKTYNGALRFFNRLFSEA